MTFGHRPASMRLSPDTAGSATARGTRTTPSSSTNCSPRMSLTAPSLELEPARRPITSPPHPQPPARTAAQPVEWR